MESLDTLTVLLLAAVFVFAAALVQVVFLAWQESRFTEKRTIQKRLLYISAGGKHGQEKLHTYRKSLLKDVGTFERFILSLPRLSTLDKLLLKARLPINASLFIILSIALGFIGLLLGLRYLPHSAGYLVGVVFLIIPFLLLKIAESRYYEKFNLQLPDALDLLARAMRSGHALTSGLEMIGHEMEEPISTEFSACVDEINLGLTTKEAMDNLCERVPLADLRFFAIAVLVQKETGGNLAEILDNISRLIRERIQFKQLVKTLTAEGRYSAMILIALPILLFIYLYTTNYDYISLLWTDETGQYMLAGAAILQVIGAYVIMRIVDIDI